MPRRSLLTLAAFLLFNATGCAVLSVLSLPVDLLVSLIGLLGDGVGALVDAVVEVRPAEGPAPTASRVSPGVYSVTGIEPTSRFRLVLSAPGFETRELVWPDDVPGAGRTGGGLVRHQAVLERVDPDVATR